MKNISMSDFKKNVLSFDKEDFFGDVDELLKVNKPLLLNSLSEEIKLNTENKAVLGFDIYQYSQFEEKAQFVIPFLLKNIIQYTIDSVNKYELFLFSGNFLLSSENYIDTGDGGFIIFDTPLHALAFSLHFNIALRQYNSYILYPVIRDIVKELNIRFSITYDKVYLFDNNIYGVGIINNARILTKDKLNRFLYDFNTNEWFLKNLSGIENVNIYGYEILHRIPCLSKYLKPGLIIDKYGIFNKKYFNGIQIFGINGTTIQKIGNIKVKNNEISIFSLFIQLIVTIVDLADATKRESFQVSIGNINTTGITEES